MSGNLVWEGKPSQGGGVRCRSRPIGGLGKGLGAVPRTPLQDLTQHAPGGWGRKSIVRADPGHWSGALSPSFQKLSLRGQWHSDPRGQRGAVPSKKLMLTLKFGIGPGANKKEEEMGYERMDLRVSDSTLSAIKKRAVAEGTSASEIARRALEAAFDNPEVSLVDSNTNIFTYNPLPGTISCGIFSLIHSQDQGGGRWRVNPIGLRCF